MPPFVPLFAEIGESQIVDKLMVVVDRDMKPALDYCYLDTPTYLTRYGVSNPVGAVGEDFPAFAAMTRGESGVFLYPLLVFGVERMSSKETESGEWLSQNLETGAGIVVKSTTVPLVKKLAEKYVRAFKAVIRKDVLEILPAASSLVEYELEIDHQYFRHGTKGTEFTQAVEFAIRIQFGEK